MLAPWLAGAMLPYLFRVSGGAATTDFTSVER